jgi:hypothetical protein
MVRALINAAGFSGMAEGHVTPLIAAVDEAVTSYYQHMRAHGLLAIPQNTIANIPEARLRRDLLAVFEKFDAALFPFANRILDKTVNAEGIAALPLLLNVWPGSKILYLKRDGIENVVSAEKYFNISLAEACMSWTGCGDAWDRIRPQLPEDSYIEIDHWELTDEPLKVTNRIAAHLEMTTRAASRFEAYVAENTQEWGMSRKRRPALAALDWSSERLFQFLSICGEQMVKQGYATQGEVESLLVASKRPATPIAAGRAEVLPESVRVAADQTSDTLLVEVTGDFTSLVSFNDLERAGSQLVTGEIAIASSHAGAALVANVIILDSETGASLSSQNFVVGASMPARFVVQLPSNSANLDLLIRLLIRDKSSAVPSCRAELSNIRLE